MSLNLDQCHNFATAVGGILNYCWLRLLPGFIRVAPIGLPTKAEARKRIIHFMIDELKNYDCTAMPLAKAGVEAADLEVSAQPEYTLYYQTFVQLVGEIYAIVANYLASNVPPMRRDPNRFAVGYLHGLLVKMAGKQ